MVTHNKEYNITIVMCGRCVIVRDPATIRRCCAHYPYKSGNTCTTAANTSTTADNTRTTAANTCTTAEIGKETTKCLPRWYRDGESSYHPSYNVCPRDHLPVLLSSDHPHACDGEGPEERILQIMQWGLVPSWHKGPAHEFAYLLNNCRSESLLDKASFRNAFNRGQRCVIPIDGFYEWKSVSGIKRPHYIQSEEKDTMLMVAGIFDVHRLTQDSSPLYTVTLITTDSHSSFCEVHHRMPAILQGADQVSDWLDFRRVTEKEAYHLIMPTTGLSWYPVGSSVNNVYYKGEECVLPHKIGTVEEIPKGVTLDKFFTRTPVKRKSEDSRSLKRVKDDNEK